MRIVTFEKNGNRGVGIVDEFSVVPASTLGFSGDIHDFLRRYSVSDLIQKKAEILSAEHIPLEEVKLCAPIPRPEHDVVCLGLNYRDHEEEAARVNKDAYSRKDENVKAVYFSKRVDEAVGTGGIIPAHEDVCDQLDYEVELAVILGRDASHVRRKDAYDYVFGYTILNDVSARNLQSSHGQWYFGKSLDGFTPIGPWIVTADEIPGEPQLDITCSVNGTLRQKSNTRNMIFDIPYIIEDLSQGMTLQTGTIISTGTPKGVALGMGTPDAYLRKGDTVRCEIEKIGVLENTVG